MAGHVFVVPGTLQGLLCDDVLISTSRRARVGRHFWPVFGWSDELGTRHHANVGSFPPGRRVFLAAEPENTGPGPRRWLVDVGATPTTPVSWLLEGIREALEEVARHPGEGDAGPRRRRIAMPVMGVGRGGFNGRRGEVIHGVLREARHAAEHFDIDVVVVAVRPSDYSALQALRVEGHDVALGPAQELQAHRLAGLARAGRLAIFMGAGTGVAAGLPSWEDLLSGLATRVGMKDPGAVSALGALDAAELLRRTADQAAAFEGADVAKTLGAHVADILGSPSRYSLSHVLLASLDVDQAITTNFDRLYELAVTAVRGSDPLVVLPDSEPADLDSHHGRRPWLLKLHGDIDDPASIVLDRRSFVRYDAQRRPLGGVLQTTLLTRHLLVVGASMTDDNVIRLIHEVAELTRGHRRSPALGTVLTLRRDDARSALWHPEFDFVDVSAEAGDIAAAAREMEIFLDRVALLAAPTSAHVLDPRYEELLASPEERDLAARLSALSEEIQGLSPSAHRGWQEVASALAGFGAQPLVRSTPAPSDGDIPVPGFTGPEDLATLWRFAATYDAYRWHGGFDAVATLANGADAEFRLSGALPTDLPSARAALLFEQRRYRHMGTDPGPDAIRYLQALTGRIAELSGGRVPSDPDAP